MVSESKEKEVLERISLGPYAKKQLLVWILFGFSVATWELVLGSSLHTHFSSIELYSSRTQWIYHHELLHPEKVLQHLATWLHLNGGLTYLYILLDSLPPFLAVAWLMTSEDRESYRGIRNSIMFITVTILPWTLLFPTANPMTAGVGVIGTLMQNHSPNVNYDYYAAFPSIHVYIACAVGWYLYRHTTHRYWLAYPLLMACLVMATANHLFADCMVAVVLFALITLIERHLTNILGQSRLFKKSRVRLS